MKLVAIMGGGYPSSVDMWPFGSEFNFDCGKVEDHLKPYYLPTPLIYIDQCCMGDSLECGGSAQQAVNLIPSDTRTVFLGFEVLLSHIPIEYLRMK